MGWSSSARSPSPGPRPGHALEVSTPRRRRRCVGSRPPGVTPVGGRGRRVLTMRNGGLPARSAASERVPSGLPPGISSTRNPLRGVCVPALPNVRMMPHIPETCLRRRHHLPQWSGADITPPRSGLRPSLGPEPTKFRLEPKPVDASFSPFSSSGRSLAGSQLSGYCCRRCADETIAGEDWQPWTPDANLLSPRRHGAASDRGREQRGCDAQRTGPRRQARTSLDG